MISYQNERIVILGLGRTGLSCVNFFLDRGIIPLVMDVKLFPRYLKQLPRYIKCCLGRLDEKWILNATLIVVSPGVSLSHPVLLEAADLGIEIIGDIELFIRETNKPIIAITGSSGKSTVTELLAYMISRSGLVAGVGGNIGTPALTLLDKIYQLYILELSSFQLEATYNLRATAATVLNISYDHMNRYPFGLSQYRLAKLKIYKNSKVCLVNSSDSLTWPIRKDYDSCYITFGKEFSDYYLEYHDGKYCLMVDNMMLLDCSEMKIFGYHNYMNALAAIALSDIMMIPRKFSLLALRKFTGLSHCLELIHENNGVRWINDSKATNVNSAIAGISSLLVSDDNGGILHILLGGDGKSSSFLPLSYWIQKDKVKIYCFGKDAKVLAELSPSGVVVTENIEQAMRVIGSRVKKHDTVLLSPACSSLDQFENYKVRGFMFSYLSKKIG